MHRRQSFNKSFNKDGCRTANKQTNTPNNFILCSLCEEKFTPNKNSPNGCLGDQERSIREYGNALDYINSCHSIINHMMAQNKEMKEFFVAMPNVPNFLEMFSMLLTQDFESKRLNKNEVYEPHLIRSGMIRKKPEDEHNRQMSDSETSEFDVEVVRNASKVNLQKFKSKLPRTEETIYEEDLEMNPIRSKPIKPIQRKSPNSSPHRMKRYSDLTPSSQECSSSRKSKPRSYSASASRTKNLIEKKSGPDLSANYSDTVISGRNKQNDLTQQELDKYAKELLGSGGTTPIHSPRSRSPHCRTPTDKSPTRQGKKSPGSTPSHSSRRYSELIKRGYSDTQRQNTDAPISKQSSLQKVTHMEVNQINQKRPKDHSPSRPSTPVKVSLHGGSNYSIYGNKDNPYEMQEYVQMQLKKQESNNNNNNNRGKVGDKEDGYERKVNLRTTASKCGVQKGLKSNSKESFNSRTLSPSDMKIIESQVQLFVEQHVERDEIKTDSEIDDDRVPKKPVQIEDRPPRIIEERSPKTFRRKVQESDDDDCQQLAEDDKFPEEPVYTTANNETFQRIQHQIGSNVTKRSQISDESSDIKSDEDAIAGGYENRNLRQVQVHRRGGTSYTYTLRH